MNPQALLALQLLTDTITDLPRALQVVMSGATAAPQSAAAAADQSVGRVYVTNSSWAAPVPVTMGAGGGGPEKEKKAAGGANPLGESLGMVTARFAAIAGPLAVIGAVLGSSVSGFQVLGTSVKLLAGAIAPVLLPATLLLSTALVALSEVLTGAMLPGMEGFFGVLIGLGLPVLIVFVEALQEAARRLDEWAKRLDAGGASEGEIAADVAGKVLAFFALPGAAAAAGTDLALGVREARDKGGEKKAGDVVTGALRDVMKSLSLSIGPKAQISGLEGIGKAVQLSALNNDPLDARMLRTQQMIYQLLERAVSQMADTRGVYYPPPSDGLVSFLTGGLAGGRGAGGGVPGGGGF